MTFIVLELVGQMSKLNEIAQDKVRAILTDTLPYEVPVIFTNDGYHERILENAYSNLTTRILLTCPPKPGPGIMLEFLTKEDGIWPGKDEHQNRL